MIEYELKMEAAGSGILLIQRPPTSKTRVETGVVNFSSNEGGKTEEWGAGGTFTMEKTSERGST